MNEQVLTTNFNADTITYFFWVSNQADSFIIESTSPDSPMGYFWHKKTIQDYTTQRIFCSNSIWPQPGKYIAGYMRGGKKDRRKKIKIDLKLGVIIFQNTLLLTVLAAEQESLGRD